MLLQRPTEKPVLWERGRALRCSTWELPRGCHLGHLALLPTDLLLSVAGITLCMYFIYKMDICKPQPKSVVVSSNIFPDSEKNL